MWVQLDDRFFHHHKVMALNPHPKLLFIAGLTHCADQLTDGFISNGAAKAICGLIGVPAASIKPLVDAGLWHKRQDGYDVHDYLEYQMSAEQIRSNRAKNADRVQSWRRSRKGNDPGDKPGENDVGNTVTAPITNDVGTDGVTGAPLAYAFKGLGSTAAAQPKAGYHTDPAAAAESENGQTDRLGAALDLLAQRKLAATTKTVGNIPGWLHGTIAGLRKDHADRIDTLPDGFTTPQAIADWLEPPHTPKLDPLEQTAAAARRIMARNDHPCPTCDTTSGWTYNDQGEAIRCPDCATQEART